MRKKAAAVVFVFLALLFILPASTLTAAGTAPLLYLNGQKLDPRVAPRIVHHTTLVPARVIAEALGASISWNRTARQVTISARDVELIMTIRKKTALVNGTAVELEAAPLLEKGTTLLPVRFIAEQLGLIVEWNHAARAVLLWTSGDAANRPAILIYHTHNRESYLSLLPGATRPEEAYDPDRNVTYLGDRLAQNLKSSGWKVYHATDDYPAVYGDKFRVGSSYAYSEKTVAREMKRHPEIRWLLDLHRDSSPRSETTVKIGGTSYARLMFVIGVDHSDWKRNEQFALQLQSLVEAGYPGLSRGIFYKDSSMGDGRYNQHLSPRSALIEVGGAFNTLTEAYRTIDILSEAIDRLRLSGF